MQIFNEDETKIYATILAIPNYRLMPTDKTVITFNEGTGRPAGSAPGVVLSGRKLGRGIRLSEGEGSTELAQVTKVPVLAHAVRIGS